VLVEFVFKLAGPSPAIWYGAVEQRDYPEVVGIAAGDFGRFRRQSIWWSICF